MAYLNRTTTTFGPLLALTLLISSAPGLSGCDPNARLDGANRAGPSGPSEAPPKLDSPGVLYVWVDQDGIFKTTEAVADIPEAAKDVVRVLVPGQSAGSEDSVWVVDLRQKPEPKALPRAQWEARGKAARDAKLAAAAPQAVEPDQVATSGVVATVYGASWCKPCHLAEDYLKSRGAKVTKKDIEEDPRAGEEMRGKLRTAGLSGASIPVLDVGGTILIGFSQSAIDRALSLAQRSLAPKGLAQKNLAPKKPSP